MNKVSETYEKRNKKLAKTRFGDYRTYLSSDKWKSLRNEYIEWLCANDRRCLVCRSKDKLNVHHSSYTSITKENYKKIFFLLCETHHNDLHQFHKANSTKSLYDVTRLYMVQRNAWINWKRVRKKATKKRQIQGNIKGQITLSKRKKYEGKTEAHIERFKKNLEILESAIF